VIPRLDYLLATIGELVGKEETEAGPVDVRKRNNPNDRAPKTRRKVRNGQPSE